jgi:hypothetical protein
MARVIAACHDVERSQVARCRNAAPTLRGYRPPQSRLTPEVTDRTRAEHGFERPASGARSLGAARPFCVDGVVKVILALGTLTALGEVAAAPRGPGSLGEPASHD